MTPDQEKWLTDQCQQMVERGQKNATVRYAFDWGLAAGKREKREWALRLADEGISASSILSIMREEKRLEQK